MGVSARRTLIFVWVVTLVILCGFGAYLLGELFKESTVGGTVTNQPVKISPPIEPTKSFVLYFGAHDARGLSAELRPLRIGTAGAEDEQQLIKLVLEELIRGPVSVLVPTLPRETTVNSMFLFEGGKLAIDFGKEIRDYHPGGALGEWITVYSIVNTLADNFDSVKAVRFLVEGSEVETLVGHVDLTEPVLPDRGMVVLDGDRSP
jgi:germination protein M